MDCLVDFGLIDYDLIVVFVVFLCNYRHKINAKSEVQKEHRNLLTINHFEPSSSVFGGFFSACLNAAGLLVGAGAAMGK